MQVASAEENRKSAQKVADGKPLNQDEARGLATARATAGQESRRLDRIVIGEPQ